MKTDDTRGRRSHENGAKVETRRRHRNDNTKKNSRDDDDIPRRSGSHQSWRCPWTRQARYRWKYPCVCFVFCLRGKKKMWRSQRVLGNLTIKKTDVTTCGIVRQTYERKQKRQKGVKLVSKFHCIETRNRVTFDSCMYAMIDVHYKKTLSFTLLVE